MPQSGLTVWLTGLPSAGKTTLARALEARLLEAGLAVEVLDGDAVRKELSRDLGFSRADRLENVRRVGRRAVELAGQGAVVVCALVSPYRESRDAVRRLHHGRFVEVYVSAPLEVCTARDVKGLYGRQRAGEISGLTGVDDPYEAPLDAEVTAPTHLLTVEESADLVWSALQPFLER